MKFKKITAITLILVLAMSTAAFASTDTLNGDNNKNESEITVSECYSSPINTNAVVSFVDPELENSLRNSTEASAIENLSNQSGSITPMGVITEVYDHSKFTLKSYSRTGQLVGPRTSEVTWKAMARGETYAVADSTTLTGTVKIEGTVKAGISEIVNQTLVGTVSASVTKTWSSTTTLTGPAAPYNSRLYMHAIDYDKYAFVFNRTDYYKVYSNGIYKNTITYAGTESVPATKKPVFMSYSKDITY